MAQRLESPGLVLAAWVAGGAVALAGALTFAELGTLFPKAGGHYVYLREAYHPLAGFLYGWGLLLMIEGGAIAAVAITFAEYSLRLVGRPQVSGQVLAVLAIVVVAAVNYLGVKPGSRLLNAFVVLKLLPLGLLIGAGFLLPGGGAADAAATGIAVGQGTGPDTIFFAFGAALIPVMFSYGGWQNANYVAEEMKDPVRDMPTSLLLGTGLVVLVYVSVNWVYLSVLGHGGLAGTTTPASDVAAGLLGPTGSLLITLGIAISNVRIPEPHDAGANPCVLRDGKRRALSGASCAPPPSIRHPVHRHRHPDGVGHRPRTDGHLRSAGGLRGLCGLDLLRPRRRESIRVSSDSPRDRTGPLHVCRTRLSLDPGDLRRRCGGDRRECHVE